MRLFLFFAFAITVIFAFVSGGISQTKPEEMDHHHDSGGHHDMKTEEGGPSSMLVSSHPADGAVLDMAPHTISLMFMHPVQLSVVHLSTLSGEIIPVTLDLGKALKSEISVPLEILPAGFYRVVWRAHGEDGHTMSGNFSFTIQSAGHHNQSHGHDMHNTDHTDSDHSNASVIGMPGKIAALDRQVSVVMKDYSYEPSSLEVKSGETILFKIINEGKLLHEFGIGTSAMHAEHRKEMAKMMEHGMIDIQQVREDGEVMTQNPEQVQMSHDHPNSILLKPGEIGSFLWHFFEPAELQFACNVPGHYELGMVGTIQVQ